MESVHQILEKISTFYGVVQMGFIYLGVWEAHEDPIQGPPKPLDAIVRIWCPMSLTH